MFFDAGWDGKLRRHSHSLLAHTKELDFGALQLDHDAPSAETDRAAADPRGHFARGVKGSGGLDARIGTTRDNRICWPARPKWHTS